MGNYISCFKTKKKENESLLITTPSCFVCGETFNNLIVYNKHIIHCNKLYKNHS